MQQSVVLVALMLVTPSVLAFNLDLQNAHVYHSEEQGDYFGFSVALHSSDSPVGSWMMVGAPRRNDSRKRGSQQPGVVMKCPFGQQCFQLHVDTDESNIFRENQSGAVLGFAQDISHGRFATCAPRWMRTTDESIYMLGQCFYGKAAADQTTIHKMKPLDVTNYMGFHTEGSPGRTLPYFKYGEFGFATHFTNKGNMLVLGSPGILNWKGSTVLYRTNSTTQDFTDEPIIHNPYMDKHVPQYALFGYAVTSGRFFSRLEVLHVAGAPRADQVSVYSFPTNSHTTIATHQTLTGEQTGSYFGAALAACDVNGDQFEDLIVGAPFFSDQEDEGRVFIYISRQDVGKLVRPSGSAGEIKGKSEHGHFGATISCIGDLDRDGFQDVAVAAPYEGTGVVYIYRGGAEGLSDEPSQRIVGTEVSPGLSGFGYSLSRGQDVDANGYVDLAVGAYRSGHAVLLRSQPIVEISVQLYPLRVPSDGLPRNATTLQLRTCPSYSGASLPRSIEVVQRVELDPKLLRLYMESKTSHVSNIILHEQDSNVENCRNLDLTLRANVNNFFEPLTMSVTYELPSRKDTGMILDFVGSEKTPGEDKFCKSCPMAKPGAPAKASAQVVFATECGTDNLCKANVTASIEFVDVGAGFVVGSSPSLTVRVTVSNAADGDPAYNTRVEITLPTPIQQFPLQCTELHAGTLLCDAGNPLHPGTARTLDITVDVRQVSVTRGSLEFSSKVVTSSVNQAENPESHVALALRALADITVSGKAEHEVYSFDTSDAGPNRKKNVTFSVDYQVEKFGPSPIDWVLLTVEVPVARHDVEKFTQIIDTKLRLNDHPVPCLNSTEAMQQRSKRETDPVQAGLIPQTIKTSVERTLFVNCSGEWECERVQCHVGPFRDLHTVLHLKLTMLLNVTRLQPALEQRDIISLGSTANVVIEEPKLTEQPEDHRNDTVIVIVNFHGQVPQIEVQLWVIIVSAIAGVILLLLVILGLTKIGFFRREGKTQLERLKRETLADSAAEPLNVAE